MPIALVAPNQLSSLTDTLCALHSHYNEGAVNWEAVNRHLRDNLLAPTCPLQLVVASDDKNEVMGFAAITFIHSLVEYDPETSHQCFMKELFVRPGFRGQGVGRSLMIWIAHYAVEKGCTRLDWTVKSNNHGGLAFYKDIGGRWVENRMSFRLSRQGMEDLVASTPSFATPE